MKKIFTFLAAALMSAGMFAQQLATPVISGATEFTDETEVTITCETEGVDIYYTTDLGSPSSFYEGSILYTGPFKLTKTAYLKVIAYKGDNMSDEARAQFVKQTEMGLQFVELPIPSTWEGDETIISATDLQGFQQVTKEQAVQWPILEDKAILIYGFEENGNAMYVMYNFGSKGEGSGLQSYKNIQKFFEHLYYTTGYEGEPEPAAPMFEMSYENQWLNIAPADKEATYMLLLESKSFYDGKYTEYDQATMGGYVDYWAGITVQYGYMDKATMVGAQAINPNQFMKDMDSSPISVGQEEIAFVFQFDKETKARTSDVEYLAFTYTGEPEEGVESINTGIKAVKAIRNGQLLIEKNGKMYNAQGALVK